MSKAKPSSWRDVIKVHPAAELFPTLPPDELKTLGADIRKNGLTSPIILIERPSFGGANEVILLDGRTRLDAVEACCGFARIVKEPIFHGARTKEWIIHAGDDFISDKVTVLNGDIDPYAYVISANIHRRHLNVEQRQHLLITLIARAPEKSDRQFAKEIGVSPSTIGVARTKGEDVGKIPHVETRIDTKGRKQPANKEPATCPTLDTRTDAKGVKPPATQPVRAHDPTHVCWQCGLRGKVGEVQQHCYPSYEDADVWLHDACISAFHQSERQREVAGAAERLRDDIAPNGAGETARLRARIEELGAENRRLQQENTALRREIEEMKPRLAVSSDMPDIPACLRRGAP